MKTSEARYVKIESQVLMGDTYKTYFVDIVTVRDGIHSHGNVRSVTSDTLARQIAREIASAIPCDVVDETLNEENAIRHSRIANSAESCKPA